MIELNPNNDKEITDCDQGMFARQKKKYVKKTEDPITRSSYRTLVYPEHNDGTVTLLICLTTNTELVHIPTRTHNYLFVSTFPRVSSVIWTNVMIGHCKTCYTFMPY